MDPWASTPMEKLRSVIFDVIAWIVKAAFYGSFIAIPILLLIAIVHFLAKYW